MDDSTGGSNRGADVRTFLIADVRGYTKYTQEQGDEAAAQLASRFAELVREVVEARQGSLLELRGDEALVAFVSARQALRAAVELQERFSQSGLARGVGIGLDSGEAIPVGEGYRGGALNLAARLCSQASAGEVLASESVIHLAAKVEGVAYVDPRTFKLKGYEDPVRAVEVVRADRARRFNTRRMLGRRARRLTARRGFRVAAAGVVIATLVALLLPRVLGGEGTTVLARDSAGMALLDAKTGHQLGFIPLEVVKTPAEAIYADGHFWVLNLDPVSFIEIDPKTGEVLHQVASPVPAIGNYSVSGNDLWVTDYEHPTLVKMDILRGREVARFTLSKDPDSGGFGIGPVADGSVWVDGAGEVLRLDPENGSVQARLPDLDGGALASGDGSIWMMGGSLGVAVTRIDPRTNTVAAEAQIEGTLNFVAAGGGFGWTADEVKGVVYKIDRSGRAVATYATGQGAREVSYSDGVLWVGNQDVGTVSGIDAVTGSQTTYRFAHPIQAVAAGSGSLLVQLNPGITYEDRIASLRGKVAKFFVGAYQLNLDPATSWTELAFEVEFATCAKLLNYPDKPSPDGWTLQPEVAASVPDVSADGRTYTFTVQPGYRFSPPSNQPVTAETFRYSIERALSPKLGPGWWGSGTPGSIYIDDIQGEKAFLAGKADHISGLRVQGDTLIITLTRPSPDLLERLAIPFFCPVPTDTPLVQQGAVIKTGSSAGTGDAVPSAGPYYIADAFNGEYTILKRNPSYAGPRPHAFDAIALREGIDPGPAFDLAEKGTWDGISKLGDSLLDPGSEVAKAWGPNGTSVSSGGQRYYAEPDGGLSYLDINASRPLFSDRRVRQAVANALDRPNLAAVAGGGTVTDQLLPPTQSGFQPEAFFPLDGPNLARARALMHGVRGTAVLVTNGAPPSLALAAEIKLELARIGIEVRIKRVENSFEAIHEPNAPYDLKTGFSPPNPPDPLGSTVYLQQMLSALLPSSKLTPILPPDWESPAVQALAARLRDSSSPTTALMLLHGPIQREVPMTGLAYTLGGTFLNPRIGCRVFPPASFGVDFAALCLAPG